jgi:hypothetical protein
MTDINNVPTTQSEVPRKKMWVFFVIFALFAGTMYGTTMYRIRSAGFLGTGKDTLAHPTEATKPGAGQLVGQPPAADTK